MSAPLIDFRQVERRRGDGFRLRVEAFGIRAGERLAIVGASGSGKSTCLDLLALTLRPDAATAMKLSPAQGGSIDVQALWQKDGRSALANLRARHFGYVLQTGGLAPFLTLAENAMLSRRLLGLPGRGPAEKLAEQLGIGHLMRRKPRQVSIGERQRAAVVRALAHEPPIVLADEPTASLDQSNAEDVMRLLVEAATGAGAALIVVTHDRELADEFGLEAVECHHDPGTRTSTVDRRAA
ncbi:MAG: ABC transporter ATP-binding protein [Minwuia sp.]|uniref:ABC transporter ATP-binding protein n=1 Tax=Minwuia sp. TaxID=2493630 RepID=UPI003A85940A